MYLYFSKQRKLQTMIAHGSPIRQGDGFALYLCFDLDFFNEESNTFIDNENHRPFIPQYISFTYKRSKDTNFQSANDVMINKGNLVFHKNSYDEVTYKLVDEERYITYYAKIEASQEITQYSGQLDFVFTFSNANGDSLEDGYDAANMSAQLYVEPTYGKSNVQVDSSMKQSNYQTLISMISSLDARKNIALEEIENVTYTSDDTEEKLLERAIKIYNTWKTTRMGWIIIGEKYNTTINGNNEEVKTLEVRDMYVLFDENNMFVISSETGIMYQYTLNNENQPCLIPMMYSINVFGDNLVSFLQSQGKANLTELLQDYLSRIGNLETVTLQDITYNGAKIRYKQNGSYHDLVSNSQLKEDLGVNDIEDNAAFNIKYEDKTLKVKNGISMSEGENTYPDTNLFTANSLKADMNLDLVPNKAASGVISNSDSYFATVKAVFDTLEKGAAGAVDQNTNTTQFNEAMRRIRYMYQYFSESTEDIDNKINKLEEIIAILDGLPENSDIYATITNIFNKIGEGETDTYFYDPNPNLTEEQRQSRTIKGRIDYLYQNADKNIIVFIRYSEPGNQDLLTIPVANWIALNQPNENYPDAEYYAVINPRTVENPDNPAFDNVVDMEIIFDKESEQEYIVGAEFDQTLRVLNIYANSLPDFAITIDTIKLISNVHHTMSLNVAESNLLANHTVRITQNENDISNLYRDKLDKATNADTNGQVKAITVNKTGATLTIKDTTDYTRQFALINDGEVKSNQVQSETYSRDKIDNTFQSKILSIKPQVNKENFSTWSFKTFNGYNIPGNSVWTDGDNIYCGNSYVLDKATSTWITKVWNGLTNFYSVGIWTDGDNIYYSSGTNHYVLNKATSTWSAKTWNGLANFSGYNIWTDGTNIYYSDGSNHYVLNKTNSTWNVKAWSGSNYFDGNGIWTDGDNIYYSQSSRQYVLDKETSTWELKNWRGLESVTFDRENIWTDGTNIYFSYNNKNLVLKKETSSWINKTWNYEFSNVIQLEGRYIWTDGTNIYFSPGQYQYVLNNYQTTQPKMNDVFGTNPYTFLVKEFQSTPDDSHYPSEKLVKDSLDLKQDASYRVSAFQTTPDNDHYPSEKLVKDSLDTIYATMLYKRNLLRDAQEEVTSTSVTIKSTASDPNKIYEMLDNNHPIEISGYLKNSSGRYYYFNCITYYATKTMANTEHKYGGINIGDFIIMTSFGIDNQQKFVEVRVSTDASTDGLCLKITGVKELINY